MSMIKIIRKSDNKEVDLILDGNIPPQYKGRFDDDFEKVEAPLDKTKAKDALKDPVLKEILKDFESRIDALEKK